MPEWILAAGPWFGPFVASVLGSMLVFVTFLLKWRSERSSDLAKRSEERDRDQEKMGSEKDRVRLEFEVLLKTHAGEIVDRLNEEAKQLRRELASTDARWSQTKGELEGCHRSEDALRTEIAHLHSELLKLAKEMPVCLANGNGLKGPGGKT